MSRLLLLVALAFVLWRVARALLAAPRAATAGRRVAGAPRDPWAVLGVPRDAGPEAIAQAHREQLKRYHPDRVADLGDELQALAHEKTLEIQRAYEALTRS